MTSDAHIILIFDLLQDVNILWPIARLAHEETDMSITILVSDRFEKRDTRGIWSAELEELADDTGATIRRFGSDYEAYQTLEGKRGIIFAGSESDLGAHATSHGAFQIAPPEFLKITLQHGFECVGFLQNREQSMAHGEDIRFAADVVCGWMEGQHLHHLRPSERDKLLVTGPSARLRSIEQGTSETSARVQNGTGLVCENLHSVRMNLAGDFKASYMDMFFAFAEAMNKAGHDLALRPHPGGQYVIRNNVDLPPYVTLNNEPMYKVDLSQYAYGISAPSSVLIDMVLAGIPTAVWQDGGGVIDAGNYAGLTRISTVDEWVAFAQAAIADPAPFLARQASFLEATGIVTDRDAVRQRFLGLLEAAGGQPAPRRILFVANKESETLQIGFLRPLKPLVDRGLIETAMVTEKQIRKQIKRRQSEEMGRSWAQEEIERFKPDIAIFSRYSGPFSAHMIEILRGHDVPIIFHFDDDLLNVPIELGEDKHEEHNSPERLNSISTCLHKSDLIYCSTDALRRRYGALGFRVEDMKVGDIYCPGTVLRPAVERQIRRVGYMGFGGHAHDFEMILPELVQFLRERPEVAFELFGSIPKPALLDEFGDRITVVPPVRPYSAFLDAFAAREWDIGICPLVRSDFNAVKANTKWVEYTSAGTAVIATSGMAYDECCADDCGLLVDDATGWREALHTLCDDPAYRYRLAANAQAKVIRDYSIERLRDQVLDMIDLARDRARQNRVLALSEAAGGRSVPRRILFVANGEIPTLQIAFLKPLQPLIDRGLIETTLLTETEIREQIPSSKSDEIGHDWVRREIERFKPDVAIFCRYSGPFSVPMLQTLRMHDVPVIFHIDDDLLNVPLELGAAKHAAHNRPERLHAIRTLLSSADLVYCSTSPLLDRFKALGFDAASMAAGAIYCSASIAKPPTERPVSKIGYMGFDHAHDFEMILPELVLFLRERPEVAFELFGSIPKPALLDEFGDRITVVPPVRPYSAFLDAFAAREWDIGICPLVRSDFNVVKANTKWVEYTLAGTAVIATSGMAYDECCADDCGLLVDGASGWRAALNTLCDDPAYRYRLAANAQAKVVRDYSTERLRDQVLDMIDLARDRAKQNREKKV